MTAIDFGNSYVSFFGPNRDDGARALIDAACTVFDDRAGTEETFYLIAPCRSERMYLDSALFHMPNWDWRAIFSERERVILRKHWVSEPAWVEGKGGVKTYSDSRGAVIQVHTFGRTRRLNGHVQVVEQALGNLPLIARTELRDERRGLRAVLEYPIRTMNATRQPMRFQADTGPLIVPDFDSKAEHMIERFDLAHVVYNVFDKAEFLLRRPLAIVEGGRPNYAVTDYTQVKAFPARNEIFCAV